jgi:hypothetical protein
VTVNAVSTIMLLTAIEAMYPGKRMIHLFLDNASSLSEWRRWPIGEAVPVRRAADARRTVDFVP